MAIRTDIFSVDWSVSPRLIWIDIAQTEVSAQDLYDTCKHLEALPSGMDEPPLCDAGGWEPLGLGVFVGITVSLFNALYAFADRPGPEWVICNMTGGNVAGFEDDTREVEIYPRYPTAYVSADRTASSSATTKEQADIEYASFSGGITYDDVNGFDGTGYAPNGAAIGTQRAPSSNVYDSRTIAETRGFRKGYIVNDMDIPIYELDGFTPFEMYGFTFIGSGKDRTDVTIPEDALVYDNTYIDCHAQGYLDGNNTLFDCLIDNLYYIKGYIESCVLAPGIITLGGNDTAHFLDCFSGVPGTGTPTIDMGGSGQPLALRNYNGGIKLINKSGPESVSIDLNSGQIKIDMTTVTNGVIVCRGNGKLIDADTGDYIHTGTYGDLVIYNELVNVPKIVDGVWNEVLASGYTAAEMLDLIACVNAAKLSGAETTTIRIRDLADIKDRIVATVDDDGNRLAVVRDVS